MRSNLVNRMRTDLLNRIPSRLLLLICSVLIMMLTLLPILWTDSTAQGAISTAPERTDPNVAAITCYGRDIVDPINPGWGSLAFVTDYFPTTVDTYYLDGLYETTASYWHISETGLVWTQIGDSATLKGEVINNANHEQRLAINYTFQPRYNWTQWSALGRTYYPKGWSLPHATWDYWELKEGTLEGKGNLSGLLSALHLPADYSEGFQVGQDTLLRNSGFSVTGWFGANGALNNETVSVDAYGYLYMLLDCDGSTSPTSTPTPIPTATLPPQTSKSVVCSANSHVDPSVPQYGNLALWTNYLPTIVQTYYDAEYKLFTASSHWNIYGNGVSWTVSESASGYSARLYGEVVNNYNGNQRLLIDFSFQNKYSWAEWSALKRTADPMDSSLPYDTWDYWELSEGTLTGQGDLYGTIHVTHRPSSYVKGFQVGNNVLLRNPGYGASGWYNMSGTLNDEKVNSTYAYGSVYMLFNCQSTVPPTPTRTPIPTVTVTPRPTVTPLPPATNTPVASAPTATPTHTPLPTATSTDTATIVPADTPTPTSTPTDTPIDTATATPMPTAATTDAPSTTIPTDVPTDVPTNTPTATDIPTATATETATETALPTETPTITNTPEPDATATPIILSLGNRVWLDADNNGFMDDAESGIRDVIVRLLTDPDGDGNYQDVIQTTATNALGYYLFTGLSEGLYVIEVEPPVEFGSSTGGASEPAPDPDADQDDRDDNGTTVGTVIRSEPIELTIGQEPLGEDNKPGQIDPASDNSSNLTIDFGLYELAASIGDIVWRDQNEDGIQDEGEPGVADVVVNLWTYNDKDGTLETKLATTTTDENGNYRFDDLDPTLVYVIEVELGPDQFLTKPDVNENGDDLVDNDVRYTGDGGDRGISQPIVLDAGEYDDTIDIGITVPKKTPDPTATTVPTSTPTFTSVPTNTPEPTATEGPTPTATPTIPPIAGPEPEGDGMSVRVDDYVAGTGDIVQVMVEGFNLDNLGTATMEFSFDPTVLSPVECNKDPDSQFDIVQCNLEFADDIIRFNVTTLRGVSGDVRLAELTFEVIGENGDTSPIAIEVFTFADSLGQKLEHTVRNGTFTVSTARRGDVNCSGKRDVVDALMISQHAAGMREATYSCDGDTPRAVNSIYMPGCDSNGDKQCDTVDSLFILQCETGIANSLCGRGLSATTGDAITSQDDAASTLTMHRVIPGTPKGTVTLPVVAAMTKDNLYSAVLDIHYDPDVLRPVECTTNELTQRNEPILALCNVTFENNGQDNDLARFNMVSPDGLSGIAELFEITFEVVGEVTNVNTVSMKPIKFTDRDGEVLPLKVNYIDDGEIVGQYVKTTSVKVFLPLIQR